jgi:hypothetical protein
MSQSIGSEESGRHYGHYRSLLRSPDTIGYIASLADFCFNWGVTMRRWEKVIQPQLPKESSTPRITWIRCITLIEADLNMCLSELFGRRLMDNTEKHKLLHPSQFRSRKGRMSISAVLLKCISYDQIRQSRMDAIVFDNDARACYDRMIPSQSAIISRWADMTKEVRSDSVWGLERRVLEPNKIAPGRHARRGTLWRTVGIDEQYHARTNENSSRCCLPLPIPHA